MSETRSMSWRRWVGVGCLLSGPIAFGLSRWMPTSASEFLARQLAARLSHLLARVATAVPPSLSELSLAALTLAAGVGLARRLADRERRWWSGVGAWLYDLMRAASLLVAVFYLVWGVGYGAPTLDHRMGLPPLDRGEASVRLQAFARLSVESANDAYLAVHGVTDAGKPTKALELAVAAQQTRKSLDALVAEKPGWALAPGIRRPVKPLLSSALFRRMGISGIYSPFWAEAHVLSSLPGCQQGQIVAHESAHQRGIQREDEANFVGFLAASRAARPEIRYAAWLFAQRQALGALARIGDPEVTTLLRARLPGVQRDVDDLRDYWAVARGRTGRLATRMNHAYLKSNRIDDGVASYGRSLQLLLRWFDAEDSLENNPEPRP